jgi:inner membrane protein
MMVLAHAGITLGATVLAGNIVIKNSKPGNRVTSWLAAFYRRIDFRILLIGALLPDIIDKPLGGIIFRNQLGSGRIFAHTLLFLVVLLIAGIVLYRLRGSMWLLVLAFGSFIHHILDAMWQMPRTMLWPFLGFEFEVVPIENWFSHWLNEFFTRADMFIPEVIGLGILLWYGIYLINRKKVGEFLRYGR